MSALASILMNAGFSVSGSDKSESALTLALISEGADIKYIQKASNIPDVCDLIVYSAAIHEDNPEYAEGVRRGIPMISRAVLLGQIMKNYSQSIAVAGTHGKTTTTGMLSEILMSADLDPTISIGGILPSIQGNLRLGSHDVFLAEACEYTNSFLELFPTADIILNVEEDHIDFFKDLQEIRQSFRKFAELLPGEGILVVNTAIDEYTFFTEGIKAKVVTFGTENPADYMAANVSYNEYAQASFNVIHDGQDLGRFVLKVPGSHNLCNALAAAALAFEMGIPYEKIRDGLDGFSGTDRRFQKKGEIGGVSIIDDYAHHPTEIRAALNAALSIPHNKLWCVFQPHTYSRTAAFIDDFAEALSLADEVVLAEIYAAREQNTIGISSADLSEKISALGTKSVFFPSFGEIEDHILNNIKAGDVVITMGAGDVYLIGEHCLERTR